MKKPTPEEKINADVVTADKITPGSLAIVTLRQEKATAELRFNKAGALQQKWEIRELAAGVIGHEWRDVPTVDE